MDPIDRAVAVDAVQRIKSLATLPDNDAVVRLSDVEHVLYHLPSVQPKKGKWEITNLGAAGVFDSCSECKRVVKHKAPFYNFCPNCGADMRGEQDGTD